MSLSVSEYVAMDATALAERIATGELTGVEVLGVAHRMATELQDALNAFVEIFDAPLPGATDGAFSGVPFVIKDLVCHAAGVLNENGSRLTQGVVADRDTALMERFRAAGLHTIGRVATPEFGYCAATEPAVSGPVRNPWDLARSPGGSSGASAAAVAAGIVPLAHANDGGGSIRIPAACSGLVGLKPSRGRVSPGPDAGEMLNGIAIEFALTRSVRDCARLLDCVAGYVTGDPYRIEPPPLAFARALERAPRPLRIAVMTQPWSGAAVSPEMVEAAGSAAKACESLGHHVAEAAPKLDYDAFIEATHIIWTTNLHHWIAQFEHAGCGTASPETLEATTWACYQDGAGRSAYDIQHALATANHVTRDFAAFFSDYDVLLTPTVASPPLPIGTLNASDATLSARDWTDQQFTFAPYTPQFNMTGQPGISLPLHRTAAGLPCGVQFVGATGQEFLLLQLAAQLEQAAPWPQVAPLWQTLEGTAA